MLSLRSILPIAFVTAAVLNLPTPACAGETASIADLLDHTIIRPELPMSEVQAFTESRVPEVRQFDSAEAWQKYADEVRSGVLEKVVFRGQAADWRDAQVRVEWKDVIQTGHGYRIRKLRYEVLPDLWVPALLYEPEKLEGKAPVALNVNGHDGNGKAAPYKQLRCINLAKRGMIVLNPEWIGMGQLRSDGNNHYRANQLDLCGTSGVAVHYLAMSRALDLLLAHDHADPERAAVAGLSGGGWQTIFISSLDTRVRLANPVAGYSSFRTRARHLSDLGDSEQTPVDLATVADYAHLTAILAPRPALLTFNLKDNCCFASGHALPPLMAAAEPVYKLFEKEDRLQSHVNEDPGTHNFERDNREALYRIIGQFFYGGSDGFSTEEIDSQGEVKTFDELAVELPEDNHTFQSLALNVSKGLPRDVELPTQMEAATRWQSERRERLAGIVRAKPYELKADQTGEQVSGDVTATYWKLAIGGSWTVPAVELAGKDPQETTIVIADGGRRTVAPTIERLVHEGNRVVALDPFYFGESQIKERDFLFALLVSAVGERPLGIQASQIAAASRWLSAERKLGPVRVVALGPRTSLIALTASALEPQSIAGVETHRSYGSLHEILEKNLTVQQAPELFCFGLLEQFDIGQIAALTAPRPVVFKNMEAGSTEKLAQLGPWCKLLGSEVNPLP